MIPVRLREELNLRPGDEIELKLEGGRLVPEPRSGRRARLARGKFAQPVLVTAPEAPAMSTESIKRVLDELT